MNELDQEVNITELEDSLRIEITSSAVTLQTKYSIAKCLSGNFNVFLPLYIAYGRNNTEEKTIYTTGLTNEITSVDRCGIFTTDISNFIDGGTSKQTGYYISLIFVDDRSIEIKSIKEIGVFSSQVGGQCMVAANLSSEIKKDSGKTLMIEWRIKIL